LGGWAQKHMKKNHRHKHMILLMNKCDLVPAWVTKRWLHTLSREYPTLAFHASQTGAFGKGALLSVLRQLARLKGDKSGISVGFVGYPNVGKSSVINTLRAKKVCKTAPVPGETKIWQYITLTKKINLIDCPGVVYYRNSDTDSSVVLKGVTRVGNLIDATEHIADVLARVKPQYLTRAYKLKTWDGVDDFLEQVARLCGKLGKGGEPDVNTAAKMVLLDWQRGKIPYFEMPPELPGPNPNAAPELPVGDPDDPIFSKAQSVLMQAAAAALELQRKRRVPVVRGLYSEEDAREEEQEGLEEDKDDVADAGAEEEENDDEDDETVEPEEEEEEKARAMEVSPAAAAEGKGKGKGKDKGRVKSDARFDSDEEEEAGAGLDDSGDESDGYGEEGLSWEAVMQSMGTAVADTAPATEGKGKASKTKAELKAKARAEPQPNAAAKEVRAAPKSAKAKAAPKVEEPKTAAKAAPKSAKVKAEAKVEEPKTAAKAAPKATKVKTKATVEEPKAAKRKASTTPPEVVSVEGGARQARQAKLN
jgi:nuclear GTP-binding protein